jgi:hypothetical protein
MSKVPMLAARLTAWVTGWAIVMGGLCWACKNDPAESKGETSAEPAQTEVLLSGSFKRVAKQAAGRAEIVRHGKQYSLRLSDTTVDNLGEVHVYLVGLPDVRSTLELRAAQTLYDFGPLEQGAKEQIIPLPSEPAPELRSVVLYELRHAVNLASAPLEPVSTR